MAYRINQQVAKALAPHIAAANKNAANDWTLSYDPHQGILKAELQVSGQPTGIHLAVKCPHFGDDGGLETENTPIAGQVGVDDVFGAAEACTKLADFIRAHEADIAAAVEA